MEKINKNKNKFLTGFTQHHFFLNKKSGAGFTLMELLVIVAIIGILSSIVLASMSSARERAKDAKRISDIKQIQIALELYYDVNSSYPASIYTGTPLATFLKVSNDPDGTNYFYSQLSSGQNYHAGAVLQQTNKLLDEDDDATGGFDGDSSNCAGGAGVDMCYDVTP